MLLVSFFFQLLALVSPLFFQVVVDKVKKSHVQRITRKVAVTRRSENQSNPNNSASLKISSRVFSWSIGGNLKQWLVGFRMAYFLTAAAVSFVIVGCVGRPDPELRIIKDVDKKAVATYVKSFEDDLLWLNVNSVVIFASDNPSYQLMGRNIRAIAGEILDGPIDIRSAPPLAILFDRDRGAFSPAFQDRIVFVLLNRSQLSAVKAEIKRNQLASYQFGFPSCLEVEGLRHLSSDRLITCRLFHQRHRVGFLFVDDSLIEKLSTEGHCQWVEEAQCEVAIAVLTRILVTSPGALSAAIGEAYREAAGSAGSIVTNDLQKLHASLRALYTLARKVKSASQ